MNTKSLRENFNLTQNELAEYIGVSVRTVQNWDNRDCMPEYVWKMVNRLLVYEDVYRGGVSKYLERERKYK